MLIDPRRHRLSGWLAIVAMVATACGGATASGAPPASVAAPTSGGAESAAPPPSSEPSTGGGIVSLGFEPDLQFFDPALAYDVNSAAAGRLLFDQLVMYDASTGLIPGLAEAMPTRRGTPRQR